MRVRIVSPNGALIDQEVRLNDIVDVVADIPNQGDILRRNGAIWESAPAPAPAPVSYNDRGDPASWDFSKTAFTADGAWHVLDLSSIVPEGATVIHLGIGAVIAYSNSYIQFRKKGNINDINKKVIVILFGNKEYYEEAWVACGTDRKIEYWMSNRTWVQLDVMVRGWFT